MLRIAIFVSWAILLTSPINLTQATATETSSKTGINRIHTNPDGTKTCWDYDDVIVACNNSPDAQTEIGRASSRERETIHA